MGKWGIGGMDDGTGAGKNKEDTEKKSFFLK